MRRLFIALAAVIVFGLLGAGYLRLFTGDPERIIGGGWLSGELVSEPVRDWSFIPSQQHNLDVESRAGWLPYSTSPWFMVHEGNLFLLLPNLFGDGLESRIRKDPDLRVRVEGRIHPVRATRVDDDANVGRLLAPFIRRQMAVEIAGESRRVSSGLDAEVWIYKLESR